MTHNIKHGMLADHSVGTNDTVQGTVGVAIAEVDFSVAAAASKLVKRTGTGEMTVIETPSAGHAASQKYAYDTIDSPGSFIPPVKVLEVYTDATGGGAEPTATKPGEQRVVNNWGGAWNNGDIAEADAALAWQVIIVNAGGFVPIGTRLIVNGRGRFVAAGGFAAKSGQLAVSKGDGTYMFSVPAESAVVVVDGDSGLLENSAWTKRGGSVWVPWLSAVAKVHNNLLGKDGGTGGQYYHLKAAEHTLKLLELGTIDLDGVAPVQADFDDAGFVEGNWSFSHGTGSRVFLLGEVNGVDAAVELSVV